MYLNFYRFLSVLLIFCSNISLPNTRISGSVIDESNKPMVGVNIYIEGKYVGTSSDLDGMFVLNTDVETPFTLVVSAIGFSEQQFIIDKNTENLSITLNQQAFMANDVVVSASRVKESYMKAPVSIEKIDALDIRRTSAVSFYESLDNLRDVELRRNSILNQSVTGRGYGTTYNSNLVQIIDGANNAPVANGSFSIGNLLGIPEIDIANIEFMPGASSALYGANAYSGIMFINSKTPFFYKGLSAQLKTGFTSNEGDDANLYSGLSVRYAQKINDKLAYKFVIEKIDGVDWKRDDQSAPNFSGVENPFMQINSYGDEIGTIFFDVPIFRTGYKDSDLLDYSISNQKFSTTTTL